MEFRVTWAIAKVLKRKIRAQGYSLKKILDLMATGSLQHGISRSTLERILRGEYSTTEDTFAILLHVLKVDKQQILAEASNLINWSQVCRSKFSSQPLLNISHLLSGDGFAQQHDSLYLAPNLIPRPQPIHHSSSELCSAHTEQFLSQKLSLKRFRKIVLQPHIDIVLQPHIDEEIRSPARIVLLGETGVGKTMLLGDIGAWISANKSRGVVIQVFLARLAPDESIEDYIFDSWLKQALGKPAASEADRQQLVELLQEDRVWLLLDGVDEVAQNGRDLLKLTEQLDGILAKANIVLTCRLNVWELESNSLRTKFHTPYQVQLLNPGIGRNLGQIGQFIKQYLPKLLANQLIRELQEPKYAATRALAANPLLLTLLCYTYHRWQGKLPDTKARLYQKFVEYLYSTKPELAIPDSFQQHQFNYALGSLAFRALDETNSPYRLTRSFVEQVWREANLDPKQLDFLEKIGFLSEVGVAQEVPDERVYRFLHPSLQEYFAALVIDHHHLLFAPDLGQPPFPATDRVLQKKWHGVYLFFMGSDSADKNPQKEALLQALINRDNYCNEYYYHSAVCLAAEGIAEFKGSRSGNAIVQQVVDWSLEGWNPEESTRDYCSAPRTSMAARVLGLSDPELVFAHLSFQLQASLANSEHSYWVAARLGSLEQGKALAIPELIRLLQSSNELIRDNAARLLSEIAPKHPSLHNHLSAYLSDASSYNQLFAVTLLHQIGCDTARLVEVLVTLYDEATEDVNTQKAAAWMLYKLDSNHQYEVPKPELVTVDESSTVPVKQVVDWLEQLELGHNSKELCQVVYQLYLWVRDPQNLAVMLEDEERTVQLVRVLQRWLNLSGYQPAFESLLCNQALYHCAQLIPHAVFCRGWSRADIVS